MHVINLLLNLNLYVNYSKNVIFYMYGAWVLQKHLNTRSHTHTHTHAHTFAHIEQMANSVHSNLHTHMYTLTLAQTIKTDVFTLFDAK